MGESGDTLSIPGVRLDKDGSNGINSGTKLVRHYPRTGFG